MVKPTPDPPICNLPPGHPLYTLPNGHLETDGVVLAERFVKQRALLEAERRNAQRAEPKPPHWWQFWRWRKTT